MKYKKLIELIKENPKLKVIPMVDSEVVQDEGYRWMGSFGKAKIREYAKVEPYGYNDFDLVFKDDTEDYFDHLIETKYFNVEPDEKAIKLAEKDIEKLKWKKAIFVNIDLPESDQL